MSWFATPQSLRKAGVLGLNARNGDYVMRYNDRSRYPLVDDKVLCKTYLVKHGMPVPKLIGVIATQHHAAHLSDVIANHRQFVLKPANGSGGEGITVVTGRKRDRFVKADGRMIGLADVEHHVSNILNGMYSLGGLPDQTMIESLVQFDDTFRAVAYQGVPDIRVIVFLGYPIMSMIRLPTRMSDGKANLHQGAVGAGIDLASGHTLPGVWGNHIISEHPDTDAAITGFAIPDWNQILTMAAGCYEAVKLGYIGVDIVIDKDRGPLILELNARPGLNIQLANQAGLASRLKAIEALSQHSTDPAERVAYSQGHFHSVL